MIVENKTIVDLNDSIDTSCNTNTSHLYMCKKYRKCRRCKHYKYKCRKCKYYNYIDYNNDKLNLELSELEKGYLLSIPKKGIDDIKRLLGEYLLIFRTYIGHILHAIECSSFLSNKFFNCLLSNSEEDTNIKFNLLILTLEWIVEYRDNNPEALYLDLDNKYDINLSLKIKEYPICSYSYVRSLSTKNNILMINKITTKDIPCITRRNRHMFIMGFFSMSEIYCIFKNNRKIMEIITILLERATNPDNTKEQAINSRDEIKDFMNVIVERYKYISSPIIYRRPYNI